MKYLKMTLAYTNRKFWYLLMISCLPAVLIAFFVSISSSLNFLINYFAMDVGSFAAVCGNILVFNGRLIWLGVCGVVLVPFFLSVLMGAIERHMRIGEFNVGMSRIRVRLNFNFLTALKFTTLIVAIFAFGKLAQATIYYAVAKSFIPEVALAISAVFYVLVFATESFLFSLIILWTPTMLHTGLSTFKSFGMAIRQIIRIVPQIMLTLLVPTLPIVALMALNSIINLRIGVLLDALYLSLIFLYYTVLMYTVFFDINGIERADMKAMDIWKKKHY
jgi:hypothetical protein